MAQFKIILGSSLILLLAVLALSSNLLGFQEVHSSVNVMGLDDPCSIYYSLDAQEKAANEAMKIGEVVDLCYIA